MIPRWQIVLDAHGKPRVRSVHAPVTLLPPAPYDYESDHPKEPDDEDRREDVR